MNQKSEHENMEGTARDYGYRRVLNVRMSAEGEFKSTDDEAEYDLRGKGYERYFNFSSLILHLHFRSILLPLCHPEAQQR